MPLILLWLISSFLGSGCGVFGLELATGLEWNSEEHTNGPHFELKTFAPNRFEAAFANFKAMIIKIRQGLYSVLRNLFY